jgi:Lon protease-like protein
MRRVLPTRPSLDHLKKQAKDLLDAHQRSEEEALARIRAAVPSFAGMDDAELARAPFALHDAQSAIAREYGLKSWSELRDEVASRIASQPPSEELMKALLALPFPDAVAAALKDAWARRPEAIPAARLPLASALPLVALRNALLTPGAFAPIHVSRTASRAAVADALARKPPTLALFSQRSEETEDVDVGSVYPTGCEAIVYAQIPDGERTWVVLEGIRWITLQSIETTPSGHAVARVAAVRLEPGDASEVSALAEALRARARPLAGALPGGQRVVAMLDDLEAGPLADLVIANLPVPVAEKARYASEPRLAERLRIAGALMQAVAASAGPPGR